MLVVASAAAGAVLARGAVRWTGRGDASDTSTVPVVYRMYLGVSAVAVFVLIVGSFSLALVQFVMLVFALGAIAYAVYSRSRHHVDGEHFHLDPGGTFERFCLAMIVAANVLTLISALAPNTNWDAGVAHLALPADYAREGRIHFVEGNVYTAYPHLVHSLYAYAFAQSGEQGVTLVSWGLGVLACMAVFELGTVIGSRSAAYASAALFATAPVFFNQSGTGGVDVPFAGSTVAALAATMRWRADGRAIWPVVAAVLAGASCGVRHTGYLVCALLAVGAWAFARGGRGRTLAVFAAVAIFAAAPWLARSWIVVGNPVYPFLSSVFPDARVTDVQTTGLLSHETAKSASVVSFVYFPWDIVMRPGRFDGWQNSPGVMVLALGLPGLLVGGAAVRWLGAYSVAGGVVFYFFQRFARYLLPFFAPMMVVAALMRDRAPGMRKAISCLLGFSMVFGTVLGAAMVHFKVPVVMGLYGRDEYLGSRVERYPAFAWMNANLPKDAGVFTLDPRGYFIDQRTFQDVEILSSLAQLDDDETMDWFRARDIRYVFYPEAYVTESPIFTKPGFLPTIERWRADTEHFRRIQILSMARPRVGGAERVEIYEVLYDGPAT